MQSVSRLWEHLLWTTEYCGDRWRERERENQRESEREREGERERWLDR